MALPFPHPSALLPPGFTMSRCTPEDVPGMTAVYMRAFPPGSPFTYWWSPSIDVMRKWHADRIHARFADPRTQQFKVVDDSTGAVVAFAKWDPPATLRGLGRGFAVYDEVGREVVPVPVPGEEGKEEVRMTGEETAKGEKREKKEKGVLKAPEGADEVAYEDFFRGLGGMAEKWRAGEKLGLSIICTDPVYHGRGIGAALIKSVLDVADAEGVPAYLEGLPLAVPLYRRFGFAEVDRLVFDEVLTIMVREPKSGVATAV
ncbi:acyl-CoA N-acyltransferase [Hypoxylon sp. EC38]|nr:acyl-CoA N-acyltransferase [Hypoxylon sp. EC38]